MVFAKRIDGRSPKDQGIMFCVGGLVVRTPEVHILEFFIKCSLRIVKECFLSWSLLCGFIFFLIVA